MRVRPDRAGKKITRAGLAVAAALVALFLAGAAAERARLASHQAAWDSLERETRMLGEWLADWDEPSETEEEAWGSVRFAYEKAVPDGETRLAFGTALNELADRTGLVDFSLVENEPEAVREDLSEAVWEDEDEEGWESPWADDEEAAAVAAPAGERTRYSYDVSFSASYRSLVRFLDGLGEMPRIVEVRRAMVRRGEPRLDVEMEIATYGRDPDAI